MNPYKLSVILKKVRQMIRILRCFRVFIPLFFIVMSGQTSFAHPHVFIEQKTKIIFDDIGLAGFKIHWKFDEMFSVMIGEDFDTDKNGILDKNEVATIKEKAFGYIAPHNYYIHIKIDDKPFAVKFVKNFNATLSYGKLIYDFFIPCHVTAMKNPKKIILSPYDPEYYSAIYFPDEKHLVIEDTNHFTIETKVERDKSTLIYYETINPLAIFLNFKQKQ